MPHGRGDGSTTLEPEEQGRRDWSRVTLEVTRSLLGNTGVEPLVTVARAIREVSDADFVLVILPSADDSLMVEVAEGDGTDDLPGFTYGRGGSFSATALETGDAVLLSDACTCSTSAGARTLAREIDAGPLLLVPLVGQTGGRGVIAVGRRRSRPAFGEQDMAPVLALANHATLALELADGRRCQQRMTALEERDRVASELHDQVVQLLFATGMSMQAVACAVSAPHAERIEQVIEATDETIVRIRSAIKQLQ